MNEIKYDNLPITLRRLIDSIGIDLAIKVCRIYSGGSIYVPKTANSKLLTLLGKQAFAKFCEEFGCQYTINIPKLDKIDNQYRDNEIFNLRDKGKNIKEISEIFNLSPRQIMRIIRAKKYEK